MDPRDASTSENIDVYGVSTLAKDFFGQSFLNTTKPVARAYFRELRSIFKKLPRHNPRVLFCTLQHTYTYTTYKYHPL